MSLPQSIDTEQIARRIDQRVTLRGIGWEGYESLLAMRGESSGTRVTYLDGELELMTPSYDHETLKRTLGRLIEVCAEERGIELQSCGSWTVRKKAKSRGVEADECFVLGPVVRPPEIPDLAVEIVWTSGGIDKLEVYRGLGVPEVWIWRDGALHIHVLHGESYARAPQSRLLPDLEPALVAGLMAFPSQTQAVPTLRAALKVSGT